MAARCAGQTGDEGDPREQYDALHARLWATLEEWGLLRLTEDLGLDLEKIGRWQLMPAESLWVNAGLIDVRLYDSDADAAQIAKTITEQLGERTQPALTILDFSLASSQLKYR